MEKKERPSVLIGSYTSTRSSYKTLNEDATKHKNYQKAQVSSIAEESTDFFKKNTARPQNRFKTPTRELNQIKGPSGSIRGHKDVVKKSLENIRVVELSSQRSFTVSNLANLMASLMSAAGSVSQQDSSLTSNNSNTSSHANSTTNHSTLQQLDELYKLDYLDKLLDSEQDLCVVYTTTLGIIRRTFEDSKLMKSILNLNLIKYEERDIYLNQEYKQQLRLRCKSAVMVPVVFVDGLLLGGIKEVERLNESGQLPIQLSKFKMIEAPRGVCLCCGDARFIACQSCNGSRKSTIHHFKFNSVALRCIKCDKNDGLVQCPVCCPTTTGVAGMKPDYNNNL